LITEDNNAVIHRYSDCTSGQIVSTLSVSARRIYITDKCTEFITFTSVDVFHPQLRFIPDLSNP